MRRSDYAWLVLAAGAARVYAHKGHHHADAKGPLQLGLVAKNAYGVEDCAAGCVVEPYRETVLVVTRSDDDREAQLDAAANALQIASELAAIAHSLGQAPPADRAAWLKEERARLEATLKEAEAAERGHDHDIGVLTLQRAPAADAGHAHDRGDEHSHHCHGGDCHAHHAHGESDAHDHGGAADHAHGDAGHAHHAHGEDEHCHGGDCHVHHDHGASEAVHDHGGDEHCHNGDCHSHHEHCEAHAHDHGAPESHEHDHGAPEAHAHDHGAPESHEHDHGGEEQCEQPIELGAGRRVVVGNTTLTEPGAYILAVETKGGKAIFQVDVRHARRAATALTPADRSRFLQAIVKLYETPAARGRQKYGAAFRSMDELWAAHALLGADGEDHDLLKGKVGADAAADLLHKSKPLRVPSEVRDVGGHRLEVKGDQTDWETFGQRFVGQALGLERRAALGFDGAAKKPSTALQATGLSRTHSTLDSNFAAFGALLEAAVQSVDPSVAVPFWAAEQATEGVPTKTWTEAFAADASRKLLGQADPTARVRVEGRWAYMPVLTKDAPQDASKPGGARRYEGYAVPLMVAEDAAAAASQYETPHELPPVATDHHHEHGHGHGEHLFHAHGGAAHMH